MVGITGLWSADVNGTNPHLKIVQKPVANLIIGVSSANLDNTNGYLTLCLLMPMHVSFTDHKCLIGLIRGAYFVERTTVCMIFKLTVTSTGQRICTLSRLLKEVVSDIDTI